MRQDLSGTKPKPPHSLARVIDELAHVLPAQGPISIFIHHNTLHAFEHLPFEEAVERAGERLGCEPFLAESRYRDKLASGRILARDVEALNSSGREVSATWLVPAAVSICGELWCCMASRRRRDKSFPGCWKKRRCCHGFARICRRVRGPHWTPLARKPTVLARCAKRCTACGSLALKRFAGRLGLRQRQPSFLFAIVIGCKQSVGLIPMPGFIPR